MSQFHVNLSINFSMQQTISDAHLFGILGALVLLDFLFLTFWTVFHPLRKIQKNVTIEVDCLFGFIRMSFVMQTWLALLKKTFSIIFFYATLVTARYFNESCDISFSVDEVH